MSRNTELHALRSTDSVERTLDISLDELNYLGGVQPNLLSVSGDVNVKTDDYTVTLADAGTCFSYDDESGKTLTIPANSSVAFPVGTVFTVSKGGSNALTLAVTDDTLIGTTTISATSTSLIIKVASTTWLHITGGY